MDDGTGPLAARLRFRHLQLIRAIDETGSLRRAAARLHVTQPAASKALGEIERILGMPLYARAAGGLVPTAQGRILADGAARLLAELSHVRDEARLSADRPRLLVRLGAPPTIALPHVPALLARMHGRHGDTLRVRLHEDIRPRLVDALLGGELDALLTTWAPSADPADPAGLVHERLHHEEIAVVAATGNPLTRRRELAWRELHDERWILPAPPTWVRAVVDACFRRDGVAPPQPVIESTAGLTNVELAAEGLGLTAVPSGAVTDAVRVGRVRRLNLSDPPAVAAFGLVWRRVAGDDERVRVVRDAVDALRPSGSNVSPG